MAKGDVTTGTPGYKGGMPRKMTAPGWGAPGRDNLSPSQMGGNKGINPGGLYEGLGQGFQMPEFGQDRTNRTGRNANLSGAKRTGMGR